jgi:hypothetical protein
MSEASARNGIAKLSARLDMRALSPFLALFGLLILGTLLNPD